MSSNEHVSVTMPISNPEIAPKSVDVSLLKMRRDFKLFSKRVKAEQRLKVNPSLEEEDKPTFLFGNIQKGEELANENTAEVLAKHAAPNNFWDSLKLQETALLSSAITSNLNDVTETVVDDSDEKVSMEAREEVGVTTICCESRPISNLQMPNTQLFSGRKNVTERQTYAGLKTMPPGSYKRFKAVSPDDNTV